MPKYDVIAYASRVESREAFSAAQEKLRKVPDQPAKRISNFLDIFADEFRVRKIPYVLIRGVDASNYDEAARFGKAAFLDVGLPMEEPRVIVHPRADEIIIDPPGEGGDETLGYIVLALGLAAAAVPVLWSLFAGRR